MDLRPDLVAKLESKDVDMDGTKAFTAELESPTTIFTQRSHVHHEPGDGFICELCVASPYADEESKVKIWPSKAKLKDHQRGHEHTKHGEIMRRLHYEASVSEDGKYRCPYFGCEAAHADVNKVTQHIRESGPPFEGMLDPIELHRLHLHDEEKRADGWYDKDFGFDMKVLKSEVVPEFRSSNRGLNYSDMKELPRPVTIDKRTHKMILGPDIKAMRNDILTRYPGHFKGGSSFEPLKEIPPQHKGVLRLGNDPNPPPFEHPMSAARKFELYGDTMKFGNELKRFVHPEPIPDEDFEG